MPSYCQSHLIVRAGGHGSHWSLNLPSHPKKQESIPSHLVCHQMSYMSVLQEDRHGPSELPFAFLPWEQLSQLSFGPTASTVPQVQINPS